MSNMNFLTEDVILFVSGTMIVFSQRDAARIKSKQFLEFGSQTKTLISHLTHIYPACVQLSICCHRKMYYLFI